MTKKNKSQTDQERTISDLFDLLPYNDDNSDEEPMYTCIDYIPEIAPQLKRSFAKAGINTTFSAPQKLKKYIV